MTNAIHGQQSQTEGIHSPYTWLWADAAARAAQTGITQAQVDNSCTGLQLDDFTVWTPTDIVPTWQQIGSGGAAANQHIIEEASNDTIETIVTSIRRTSAAPLDNIGGAHEIQVEGIPGDKRASRWVAGLQDRTNIHSVVLLTGVDTDTEGCILAIGRPEVAAPPALEDIVTSLGPGSVIVGLIDDISQVPTGRGTAVIAGEDNSAAQDYAFVAAGRENQGDAVDSLVSGRQSVSRFPASRAHASNGIANPGDAQVHELAMKVVTVDNTPAAILDDGGNSISFADDTTFTIKLDAVARNITNPPQNAYYRAWARGYCSAGTVTISASAKEIESEDTGVFDINFTASTNEVVIEVEGHVTDTTYWMAWVTVLELIG